MNRQLPPDDDWGYNVIGFLSGNFGLGTAARNTLHALQSRNERIACIDIDPGRGRREPQDLPGDTSGGAPFETNLFHVNPNEIRIVGATQSHILRPSRRLNIAVPFWELPHLPVKGWRDVLGAIDVVLAPTRYIQDAVTEALPETRVLHYPQGAFLPAGVHPDRDRFALRPGTCVFYMSLDVASDPERKNPAAALRAFKEAFPNDEDVLLAVRANNPDHSWSTRKAYQLLSEVLGDDPRVRVFDEPMSFAEVLSLSASADAYVSLHRSEGLGLNLMEAMSLGKPVITTAWSGNMDFNNAENSLLVDYELIPVEATNAAYAPSAIGPGQTWADPNAHTAAQHMRAIYSQPELRTRIGEQAAADMEAKRREFEQGSVFDRVHELYTREWASIAGDPHRNRALRSALSDSAWRQVRRAVGRGLRKAGLR
jgi:glycosyltransferase involved in cell wall biosynthesis